MLCVFKKVENLKCKQTADFLFSFSVDCLLLCENVSIEKQASLTQPNSLLGSDTEWTVPWKFCTKLQCFQCAWIPTKLSTSRMSFRIGMKLFWCSNSKYPNSVDNYLASSFKVRIVNFCKYDSQKYQQRKLLKVLELLWSTTLLQKTSIWQTHESENTISFWFIFSAKRECNVIVCF